MARSIDEAFDLLITWTSANSTENARAKQHRATIDDCLTRRLGMSRSFRSGSFGNGTNIAHLSDVDLFAVFPTSGLTENSAYFLNKMRDILKERLPRTDVRVRAPAVVVPFGTEEQDTFEVVPADYKRRAASDHNVYDIPDRYGGWMEACPMAHNAYVLRIDKQLNGRVRPLIRLMKAWKYYNSVPIRSFYLEMQTARCAQDEDAILYPFDVKSVLRRLDNTGLSAINDPTGIVGRIHAGTSSQIQSAKGSVSSALTRAEKAVSAEAEGNTKEAFDWWDKVFGGKFPVYY